MRFVAFTEIWLALMVFWITINVIHFFMTAKDADTKNCFLWLSNFLKGDLKNEDKKGE